MSVPYKIQQKEQASEELLVGSKGQLRASEKIPLIARSHVSERALKTLDIVRPAQLIIGTTTAH